MSDGTKSEEQSSRHVPSAPEPGDTTPDIHRPVSQHLEIEREKLELEKRRLEHETTKQFRLQRFGQVATLISILVAAGSVVVTAWIGAEQFNRKFDQQTKQFNTKLDQQNAQFSKQLEQQAKQLRAPNLNRYWEDQFKLCQDVVDTAGILTVSPRDPKERKRFMSLMRGRTGILSPFDEGGLRRTMESFLDRVENCGSDCGPTKHCIEAMSCYCHVEACKLLPDPDKDPQSRQVCSKWTSVLCDERRAKCEAEPERSQSGGTKP